MSTQTPLTPIRRRHIERFADLPTVHLPVVKPPVEKKKPERETEPIPVWQDQEHRIPRLAYQKAEIPALMLVVAALSQYAEMYSSLPGEIYLDLAGYTEYLIETGEPVYLAAIRPQMGYTEIRIEPWPLVPPHTAICYGKV